MTEQRPSSKWTAMRIWPTFVGAVPWYTRLRVHWCSLKYFVRNFRTALSAWRWARWEGRFDEVYLLDVGCNGRRWFRI